ncbi:hypothetical protein LTR10_004443 [Elasticomyces elasticus]|nr:hypothetical protein LTR10_004443 [Elasticomyces elasticus]KAK4976761.1 hypothetical protein LTR42_002806 [Elasticomyces elasticus]
MSYVPDLENGMKCFMSVDMIYDRVDAERGYGYCVFRENEETTGTTDTSEDEEWGRIYDKKKYSKWSRRILWYMGANEDLRDEGGRFDMPPWVIRIMPPMPDDGPRFEEENEEDSQHLDEDEIVNDTEIPEFTFDVDKCEISFNWIGTFTKLLSEEGELAKRQAQRSTNLQDQLRQQSARQGDGFDFAAFLHGLSKKQGPHSNRKQIRRERIMRFYQERHDFEFSGWGADEREALRKLVPISDPFALLGGYDEDDEDAGDDDEGGMNDWLCDSGALLNMTSDEEDDDDDDDDDEEGDVVEEEDDDEKSSEEDEPGAEA